MDYCHEYVNTKATYPWRTGVNSSKQNITFKGKTLSRKGKAPPLDEVVLKNV